MKTKLNLNFLKTWLVAGSLLFLSGFLHAQTPVQKNGQLKVQGLKLCNQYGNPIQLRGMSTHGIQWYGWGGCLNEASLDALAYDWGSDILRISLYVQEGGYVSNPAGFTAQVERLIDEATERGMYALVDWHQLTPGDPNANLSYAKTFFTAIATKYKNQNNIIYDICNEPNGVQWSAIKNYADQIIPVIRAIDADAPIFIGTHAWGSMGVSDGRTAQDIVSNPVNFPNIMYTFHFYAADHGDEYYNMLNWASDRLPVFVTEFGTQEASGDGPNNFTMSQRYIDLMRTKKIGWTNWNYSDDFRSGAVWTTGTCGSGPWTTARLKPAGAWIRERMLSPADDFPGGGNIAPTVSITSPANNAAFTAPGSITINANAADSDGSVSKVEFFNGSTLLSTDNASPYSFAWTNVAAGSYTINVKATDNLGATATASITVTVTNPVVQTPYGGTAWAIPGKIEAENYDLGGQNVAYNDNSAGNSGNAYRTAETVDVEPCTDAGAGFNVGYVVAAEWLEYTVNVSAAGTYNLQARVAATTAGKSFRVEMDGQTIATINVPNTGGWQNWTNVAVNGISLTAGQKVMRIYMVTNDFNINYLTFTSGTVTNQPPAVSISSPANNSTFTAPASITINAVASDADGTVSQVQFFNGSTLLGTDNSSPYSFAWTNVAAGSYAISAKATDNSGAVTTSAVVAVVVNNPTTNVPPTVSLSAPANNASYTAPASITINANAADSDGSVTKVEFFNGSTSLGSDASTPYAVNWTNVTAGTYTLTAKATDNSGAVTTSSAITVTVTNPTGGCSGIPQYVENGGYVAGSIVQNAGGKYECRPWPYSGWCNGAAWAYGPGTGAYWADAWVSKGSCNARMAAAGVQTEQMSDAMVIAPNPANSAFQLDFSKLGFKEADLYIVDAYGNAVMTLTQYQSDSVVEINTLPAGMYMLKIVSDGNVYTQKMLKK